MTLALVLWEMFPWPLVFPLFSCPLKHPFLFLHFLQTRGTEALERFLSSPALSSHSHGTSYRSRGLTQHAVTQWNTEMLASEVLSLRPLLLSFAYSFLPRHLSSYSASCSGSRTASAFQSGLVADGPAVAVTVRSRLKRTKHHPPCSLRNALLLAWAEPSAQNLALVLRFHFPLHFFVTIHTLLRHELPGKPHFLCGVSSRLGPPEWAELIPWAVGGVEEETGTWLVSCLLW